MGKHHHRKPRPDLAGRIEEIEATLDQASERAEQGERPADRDWLVRGGAPRHNRAHDR